MSPKGMTSSDKLQAPAGGGKRTLTAKQQLFLDTISQLTKKLGMPPSQAEIARELGVTKATVTTLIRRFRAQGLIEPGDGNHRSIRLAKPGRSKTHVDRVDTVAS